MANMDFSVFLRSLSIFSIVAGHLEFLNLPGGSLYLIFLSGFNFVLFTMPKIEYKAPSRSTFNSQVFTEVYFGYVKKIVIPTFLYTCFLFVYLGQFYPASLFMISNFIAPMYGEGLSFWFIEILLQILLIFGLIFYTNRFYYWFKFNPYSSMFVLYCAFFAISIACRILWDTSDLLNRLPHLMMYVFLGGALVALSTSRNKKILSTMALSFISLEFFIFDFNQNVAFLLVTSIVTIWLRTIVLPKAIIPIITLTAMSSLFIYLTHFQSFSLMEKLPFNSPAIVNVVFAFIVGIIVTQLWKKRTALKEQCSAQLNKALK